MTNDEAEQGRYLGDGVYVAIEHGLIVLTTGAHLGAPIEHRDATICIDPPVLDALETYVDEARKEGRLSKS